MKKDISWNIYFEDNNRFADFINGCICNGKQWIHGKDLSDMDSRNIQSKEGTAKSAKYRDMIRKVAQGINFIVIGIEHQEKINYGMPLTVMQYDVGQYDKQRRELAKELSKEHTNDGEWLYQFRKESKLYPVVTFVLYAGESRWDGATELYQILDMTDIPEEAQRLIQNYKIQVIDIGRWENCDVFQTDLRQVFLFIKYSSDKSKLKKLIQEDEAYQHLAVDTFELLNKYTNIEQIKRISIENAKEVNMCKGLEDWGKEEREIGRQEGEAEGEARGIKEGKEVATRTFVLNMLNFGMEDENIIKLANCNQELIDELRMGV